MSNTVGIISVSLTPFHFRTYLLALSFTFCFQKCIRSTNHLKSIMIHHLWLIYFESLAVPTLWTGFNGKSWLSDWSKSGWNPRSPIATSLDESSLDPDDSRDGSEVASMLSTDAASPEPSFVTFSTTFGVWKFSFFFDVISTTGSQNESNSGSLLKRIVYYDRDRSNDHWRTVILAGSRSFMFQDDP